MQSLGALCLVGVGVRIDVFLVGVGVCKTLPVLSLLLILLSLVLRIPTRTKLIQLSTKLFTKTTELITKTTVQGIN